MKTTEEEEIRVWKENYSLYEKTIKVDANFVKFERIKDFYPK